MKPQRKHDLDPLSIEALVAQLAPDFACWLAPVYAPTFCVEEGARMIFDEDDRVVIAEVPHWKYLLEWYLQPNTACIVQRCREHDDGSYAYCTLGDDEPDPTSYYYGENRFDTAFDAFTAMLSKLEGMRGMAATDSGQHAVHFSRHNAVQSVLNIVDDAIHFQPDEDK